MTEIFLYGEIENGAAGEFIRALPAAGPVTVRLNSGGGAVNEALAIFNALDAYPGPVTTTVDGFALSAASLVFMAGGERLMAENALLMLHSPWLDQAAGNAGQLRQSADALDKIAEAMISGYSQRSGKTEAEIRRLMTAETWLDAQEALMAGFATRILRAPAIAASFDLSRFSIPDHLRARIMTNKIPPAPPAAPAPATAHQPADATLSDASPANIEFMAAHVEALRKSAVAEYFGSLADRFSGREFMQNGSFGKLLASCMADPKCTVNMAQNRMLDLLGETAQPVGFHMRQGHVSGGFHSGAKEFVAAAVDHLALRAGIHVKKPHVAARDLGRMTISDIAERCVSMSGRSTRDLSKADLFKAAMTTSDFPSLLANLAGKSLQIAYGEAPATFRPWTGTREVPDFKPQTLAALSETPELLEVLEAGEYQHGALVDSAEIGSVKTYGRILRLTRQALVNDDLSAFTRLPQVFAQSAVRVEADLVYGRLVASTVLSDGKALFHEDHGNLAAAGAALSLESLGAARTAMRKQRGLAGLAYIDPQPRFLIVPVALESTAEVLIASLVDPSKNNATPNLEWIRGLELIADPRLDADSESAWYLAAAPTQIEGITRLYLQDATGPVTEQDNEFEVDAFRIKCRIDVGVMAVDYRALYKSPTVSPG